MSEPIARPELDGVAPAGPTVPSSGVSRLLAPFRSPAYRPLAVALVLSAFAQGVWLVGLVWEVIALDGGPAALSVVSTAAAVGVLLPSLAAGVVADRVPQRTVLIGTATVEVTCMGLAAGLSLAGLSSVWQLAALSFVIGVGLAFYYPAYSALLPSIVPGHDLQAVNGFEGMVRPTIGQAVGPAVAGVVVGIASPGAAFAVAALASAGALVAVFTVPRTPLRRDLGDEAARHPLRTLVTDVAEGFGYMVRTPWLLSSLLFGSAMILVVMGPFEVLVPFVVKDSLGGGPGDHALVLAAFGIGGAVGSLVMGALPMPRRYLTSMNLMWGFACLPLIVMGVATALWQLIVAGFVCGTLFSAPMVIWGTLLQRRVPPALLGRVASLDFFVSISLMPVSMAMAGPVSEAIGVRTTFLIAGVVPVVAAAVAIVWARLPQDEIAHPLRDEPEVAPESG